MKKWIAILTVSALLLVSLPMTAFAHGGHGSGHNNWQGNCGNGTPARQTYTTCPVENCNIASCHEHNGKTYLPQGNKCNGTGQRVKACH